MSAVARRSVLLVAVFTLGGLATPTGATAASEWHITDSTTLTEDFHGAIYIEDHDVTLDCAGFAIYPDGANYQNGISIYGVDRVTVTNCVIKGGAQNVYAEDVEDFHFVGNTVLETYHWDGLRVHYGVRTLIENNHAEGNARHGLTTGWGTDETYRGNTAVGNGSSGIAVGHSTTNVSLFDNVATGNGEIGFSSHGVTTSHYEGNTATQNRLGFGMSAQTDLTLVRNNANQNGEIGFALHHNSDVTYLQNKAAGNGLAGFYTSVMHDVVMRGNSAINNGGEGFALWESTSFLIEDNVARNNVHGILLGLGSSHTVVGNTIKGSTLDGLIVADTHASVIRENKSDHNGKFGFSASGTSSGNLLTLNSARKNGQVDAYDNTGGLNTWTDNEFGTVNFN